MCSGKAKPILPTGDPNLIVVSLSKPSWAWIPEFRLPAAKARIFQLVTNGPDLESKSDLIRGYHDDPKSLFDINGNKLGTMEITS